jgi:hypothetical protein
MSVFGNLSRLTIHLTHFRFLNLFTLGVYDSQGFDWDKREVAGY